MTQPGTATAVATQETVGVTTPDPGLRSLNPADGLFLRAEHLKQIQEYARELARVGAIATGTGVAYGYGLSVDRTVLHVTPGLAIDQSGRPLRSRVALTLDLSALTLREGRFWVVEVTSAPPVPAGSEPVFGELCADTCAAGATIQPWLDDAVRVQVTPNDTLAGLKGVDPLDQRSWLASAYFEQERRAGKPWLTPGGDHTVAPILGRPWQAAVPGGEPVAGAAVPIGALLIVNGQWVLDVWIARRDLVAAPARTGWEAHLSLRPWELFLAQVLQFQAQLAQVSPSASGGIATVADVERLYAELLRNKQRSASKLEDLFGTWREQQKSPAIPGSLASQGFQELPPAGFLPVAAGAEDIADQLRAMFGTVKVTVRHGACRCRAACRHGGAASRSDPADARRRWGRPGRRGVDPGRARRPPGSDHARLRVGRIRPRPHACRPPGPAGGRRDVYSGRDPGKDLADFANDLPRRRPVRDAHLPGRGMGGATEGDRQAGSIEVEYRMQVKDELILGVIGTYADERRRPLALVRAGALVAWLTGLDAPPTWDVLAGTQIVVGKSDPESIWLVFLRKPEG